LSGKRVLLLGAETDLARALAISLAEAGADVAVVAGSSDAGAAFAAQRLSRRLTALGRRSPAQAIDGTNEMAVRVMVRQIGKALGGLDAVVIAGDPASPPRAALDLALRFGAREMTRRGGSGRFVLVGTPAGSAPAELPPRVELRTIATEGKDAQQVAEEALDGVAGEPDEG
jgi:hypothetical protein